MMRHYEIVFMIHPDQGAQVHGTMERYKSLIEKSGGIVHRSEDWGRRQLAYPIQDFHKAYYALMNIECSLEGLNQLLEAFRFNDAVLRHLLLKRKRAHTEVSPMVKEREKDEREKQARAASQERFSDNNHSEGNPKETLDPREEEVDEAEADDTDNKKE